MSDKSTEYLCEEVALNLFNGSSSLTGIQKTHANDRIWSEDVKSIMVKATVEETMAPSNSRAQTMQRVQMEVLLISVIPEGNALNLDTIWRDIEDALLRPSYIYSPALTEFSHFTISGLSSSEVIQDNNRYMHTRKYNFIVARR